MEEEEEIEKREDQKEEEVVVMGKRSMREFARIRKRQVEVRGSEVEGKSVQLVEAGTQQVKKKGEAQTVKERLLLKEERVRKAARVCQ